MLKETVEICSCYFVPSCLNYKLWQSLYFVVGLIDLHVQVVMRLHESVQIRVETGLSQCTYLGQWVTSCGSADQMNESR